MPADLYLQFLPLTTGVTATTNGAPVDLLKGTDAQKYNSNALNLLAGKDTRLLSIRIVVANTGGATPTMTAQYQESDGDTNAVPASGTFVNGSGSVVITANGEYFIPFAPLKRWGRLQLTGFSGAGATFDVHSEVIVRQTYP